MPKPPFIPPDSKNLEGRLAWLYWLETTDDASPREQREIRELERELFGVSRFDEDLKKMKQGRSILQKGGPP